MLTQSWQNSIYRLRELGVANCCGTNYFLYPLKTLCYRDLSGQCESLGSFWLLCIQTRHVNGITICHVTFTIFKGLIPYCWRDFTGLKRYTASFTGEHTQKQVKCNMHTDDCPFIWSTHTSVNRGSTAVLRAWYNLYKSCFTIGNYVVHLWNWTE